MIQPEIKKFHTNMKSVLHLTHHLYDKFQVFAKVQEHKLPPARNREANCEGCCCNCQHTWLSDKKKETKKI